MPEPFDDVQVWWEHLKFYACWLMN